jgi:class 3 adenylate cyclase/tetratricopeptide (TPR) repeat protein
VSSAVRKTVTVLFCDLVGSTALGDSADPEVLQELMSRYHAELRQILERHGGTVEKFVGDAAMAVFGIPQVHEDDALRAVRAALEVREAVAALGLEVRIGVNTGEVVAGAGETLVTGDAVNVAARLEQAAQAGEILLGEGTQRLVRSSVRTDPVVPLELKGKAEAVAAFRLVELLPDVPAFTRAIGAPFVGREQELGTLERALEAATEQRLPQLVTIVGPPGIGKSRLVRELVQRSDARVLVGRCLSYGEGITYWPLQEIAQQVGPLDEIVDDELARPRIAAALGEGTASSEEIAWGFRKLFEALARERPLVVVLDDIHWAEPTLLDLIEYVAAFASDAPLVLLCTARPDLFDARPAWATPKPNATLLTLEPLASEQTGILVEELGALTAEAKERIVEAAEGNPLFVEQLVAHQAESGNGAPDIPPTIQALLAARIDRLEPDERAVIERASVEGRLFHRGSVQELVPEPVREDVGGHLLTLVRKEFVRPDRATVPGDDGFRFGHVLICDAAYDSIPKRLRAELHERFAGWLEATLDGEAPDEILGYHLEQAYRYRVELRQDDEIARTLALRAVDHLAAAGRRAHARTDAPAACSLLTRATELLPDDDPALPSLQELLGYASYGLGDVRHARESLSRAQSAAARAGQRNIELRARMTELVVRLISDPALETGAAIAEARAAIAELEPLEDPESLLRAWHAVTEAAGVRSDFALLEEGARRRLELARQAGFPRDALWATYWLTLALAHGPAPVEEAIPPAEDALADLSNVRVCALNLALLHAYAGHREQAAETVAAADRSLLELIQQTTDSMNVGWIAMLDGDPGRAEAELRAAADALAATGWHEFANVSAVLAEVLCRLARDEEAEEWTRRSERASLPEQVLSQAQWRSTRAKVLAARGETEDASRLASEAVVWARRSDGLPLLGDTLFARGDVLRLLGRPGDARTAYEEALEVYQHKGIIPSIERAKQALAELVPA